MWRFDPSRLAGGPDGRVVENGQASNLVIPNVAVTQSSGAHMPSSLLASSVAKVVGRDVPTFARLESRQVVTHPFRARCAYETLENECAGIIADIQYPERPAFASKSGIPESGIISGTFFVSGREIIVSIPVGGCEGTRVEDNWTD